MNWQKAVQAMRAGQTVVRRSEQYCRLIDSGEFGDLPVYETGREGYRLMHAWTVDEKPVQVFVGSVSRCLYVPGDEDLTANDWEVKHEV